MTATIRLQHGTSFGHYSDILANGLRPRGVSPSVWEQAPSDPDHVYLTKAYAFYFGQNAVAGEEAWADDILIVEAEVDIADLSPDEDYIVQMPDVFLSLCPDYAGPREFEDKLYAVNDALRELPFEERIVLAQRSLAGIGNARHRGAIAPSRFTRMARVPKEDISRIVFSGFDPFINVHNYRFCGEDYRQMSEALMTKYALG